MNELIPFCDVRPPFPSGGVHKSFFSREEHRREEPRKAPIEAVQPSPAGTDRFINATTQAISGKRPNAQTDRKTENVKTPWLHSFHLQDLPQAGKQGGQKPPSEKEVSTASRMVGAFKIGYALLVAGAFNAFLFGTPLKVAGGLSTAFAGMQALLATKIERGETPWSRKVLQLSRKITKTDDKKPDTQKDERVMAPVWGGVAALLALMEASMNDLYHKIQQYRGRTTEKKTEDIIRELEGKVSSSRLPTPKRPMLARAWNLVGGKIHALQLKGVRFRHSLELGKALTPGKAMLARVWNFSRKKVRGNRTAGYALTIVAAFAGGYLQTIMAAFLQNRLTRKGKPDEKPTKASVRTS